MPSVTTVAAPPGSYFLGLLSGVKWATNSLTYSFPTSGLDYGYYEGGSAFGELSPTAKNAVRSILANYSSVASVTFTEVSGGLGDLRFADSDGIGTGLTFFPSEGEEGGDVWIEKSGDYGAIFDSPQKGDYGYFTYIHEIGHALGLKHGHENTVYGAQLSVRDSIEYSVMTYRSYIGASTDGYTVEFDGFPQTLMQDDISALQHMYGANYDYNSGDTVYRWSPTTGEMFVNGVGQGAPSANRIFMTIWDGGGTDTYDFSNYATNLTINLDPGGWSSTSNDSPYQRPNLAEAASGTLYPQGNIANAMLHQNNTASLIENAIGGPGNDDIWGNSGNNYLIGGSGNDRIGGFTGFDTLLGGDGNDELRVFGLTKDDVVKGGAGNDWLRIWKADADENPVFMVSGATSLEVRDEAGNLLASEIEALEITLGGGINFVDARGVGPNIGVKLISIQGDSTYFGGAGNDTLTGGYEVDKLDGGGGIDTIEGAEGNDTLTGGAGNDWIRGGTGVDTAAYSGSILDYAIRRVAGTNFKVIDARAGSPDGNDSVTDVENFRFYDFTATSFVTDGSGQAVSSTGTGWKVFWDPSNAQAWSAYVETFNGANQKLTEVGRYDTGAQWKNFWDPGNAQIWSFYSEYFNAAGVQANQLGTYDTGARWTNNWDANNDQIWSFYSEHFNTAGIQANQKGTYDSGARWTNNWDADNDQIWSYYSEYFNAAGVQANQIGTYDTGARWSNNWDANDDQIWSYYSEYFNTAGVQANQIGTYDSGARWSNNWDADNNQSWSYYSEYFLANGNKANQIGVYDDGAQWKNYWDADSTQAWQFYSEHWNAAGEIVNRVTTWDDGSQTTDWFI